MDPYIIIYSIFSILLVYIIFEMADNIVYNCSCNKTDSFDTMYNVPYSSEKYSHTVNLPINDPISCSNFCGPNGKCLKTGEQCLTDLDCTGCKPRTTPFPNTVYNLNAQMSEASGKLGPNLTYSPLTTGLTNDADEAYPGSYNTEVGMPYLGKDKWEKDFNQGLALYNKRQENIHPLTDFEKSIRPAYPVQLSMTGLFYETTPLPGNIPTNMG